MTDRWERKHGWGMDRCGHPHKPSLTSMFWETLFLTGMTLPAVAAWQGPPSLSESPPTPPGITMSCRSRSYLCVRQVPGPGVCIPGQEQCLQEGKRCGPLGSPPVSPPSILTTGSTINLHLTACKVPGVILSILYGFPHLSPQSTSVHRQTLSYS